MHNSSFLHQHKHWIIDEEKEVKTVMNVLHTTPCSWRFYWTRFVIVYIVVIETKWQDSMISLPIIHLKPRIKLDDYTQNCNHCSPHSSSVFKSQFSASVQIKLTGRIEWWWVLNVPLLELETKIWGGFQAGVRLVIFNPASKRLWSTSIHIRFLTRSGLQHW